MVRSGGPGARNAGAPDASQVDPALSPDGRQVASSGTALQPGLPTALFQPRIVGGGTPAVGTRQQYDVAPDGRFLINVSADETNAAPITVITNWKVVSPPR